MSGFQFGVMLGAVLLRDFEVPESVGFGGRQQIAVHRLPGGGRVIDSMGPDDRDVTWSGMMVGPDAADRARALDTMRIQGVAVPLLFGDMACEVIVSSFDADYRRSSWIGHYRIRCMVVTPIIVPDLGLTGSLAADLSATLAIDLGNVVGLGDAVVRAQSALIAAGALPAGTAGQAFATALNAASGSARSAQLAAEAAMASAIAAGEPSPLGMIGIAAQAAQLAKAGAAAGLLARAVRNLQGAS